MTVSTQAAAAATLERYTIAAIPESDRHGRPRDLFTIWFSSNIMPLTFVTGALAPVAFGLPFGASIAAIVLGNLLGALFMALHSAPRRANRSGTLLGASQIISPGGEVTARACQASDGETPACELLVVAIPFRREISRAVERDGVLWASARPALTVHEFAGEGA